MHGEERETETEQTDVKRNGNTKVWAKKKSQLKTGRERRHQMLRGGCWRFLRGLYTNRVSTLAIFIEFNGGDVGKQIQHTQCGLKKSVPPQLKCSL